MWLAYRSSEALCANETLMLQNVDVTRFVEYLKKVSIWVGSQATCIFVAANSFESLQQIDFHYVRITPDVATAMNSMLMRATCVKIHQSSVRFMFDEFIQQCKEMTHLQIEREHHHRYKQLLDVQKFPATQQIWFGAAERRPLFRNVSNPNINYIHVNSEVFSAVRAPIYIETNKE